MRLKRLTAVTALALTVLPGIAAAGSAADLYYERTVIASADARCRLFTPQIGSALRTAQAQARGAALRAGVGEARLRDLAGQAQARSAGAACGSKDLNAVAARVRQAFEGYGKLQRMSFPGDVSSWSADRMFALGAPIWRLSQVSRLDGKPLMFGLAGERGSPPGLVAVTDFGDSRPYGARLVMRDPVRAPDPYLGALKVGTNTRTPLQARTPPRFAARVFNAADRTGAHENLLPAGLKAATAFRFPADAAAAIAALDPREAVAIEFLYSGRTGDVARTAYVEVGDFAAGQAFLSASAR